MFIQLREIPDIVRYRKEMRLLRSEMNTDVLDDPEVDVKFVIGNEWMYSNMIFYKNVKREGVDVWQINIAN